MMFPAVLATASLTTVLAVTNPDAKYAFWTQLLTLLTVIIAWASKHWSDKKAARKVEEKVAIAEAKLSKKIDGKAQEIADKVDENTEISKTAFSEANGHNAKIAMLEEYLQELKALRAKSIKIDQTTTDTNQTLHAVVDPKPKSAPPS